MIRRQISNTIDADAMVSHYLCIPFVSSLFDYSPFTCEAAVFMYDECPPLLSSLFLEVSERSDSSERILR